MTFRPDGDRRKSGGRASTKVKRRSATLVLRLLPPLAIAAVCSMAFGGCGSKLSDVAKTKAEQVARAAFIKSVNLRCSATKAQISLAGDVGRALGMDTAAKRKADELRRNTEGLRQQLKALRGPPGLRKTLDAQLREAAAIPAKVSNGQLSVAEGRSRLETLRTELRNEGLGECVG